MSPVIIARSQAAAQQRMAFCLQNLTITANRGRDHLRTLKTAMEILSRVAVRLETSQLLGLLKQAMSYYRMTLFRQQALELSKPLKNLLARTLDSLPRSDVEQWLPELFSLPLPNALGESRFSQYWSDPIRALPNWWLHADVPAAPTRFGVWDGIISHLLSAADGTDATDRSAAVLRLFYLHLWKFLTAGETAQFARALWAPKHLDPRGWPKITDLVPSALLSAPEEHPGQARLALLRVLDDFSKLPDPNSDPSGQLASIGELLEKFVERDIPTALSIETQSKIWELIRMWAANRPRPLSHLALALSGSSPDQLQVLEGIAAILARVDIPPDLRDQIWEKVAAIDVSPFTGSRAFALYSVLMQYRPAQSTELVDRLRRALFTDHEDEARIAVRGLFTWLSATQNPQHKIDVDLDDLVREISLGIAARRASILRPALELAIWIYTDGPQHLRELILRDCEHGLAALLTEANYSRSDQTFDTPEIRAASFRLARAMDAAGFGNDRGITGWLAAAADDPLPEVRNATARKL